MEWETILLKIRGSLFHVVQEWITFEKMSVERKDIHSEKSPLFWKSFEKIENFCLKDDFLKVVLMKEGINKMSMS